MKRKIIKTGMLGFACGCLLLGSLYVVLVWYPKSFFSESVSVENLTLRSDRTFDEEQGRRILVSVARKLRASSWYDPDAKYTAHLCNDPWKGRLYFALAPQASGLYFGVSKNVFLRSGDVALNQITNFRGEIVKGEMTLEYFIAHEFTHVMQQQTNGTLGLMRMENWVKEGYADYIARGSLHRSPEKVKDFLMKASYMDHPSKAPYLKYNMMVGHLLDHKGWSVEQLHESHASFEYSEKIIRKSIQEMREPS